MGGASYAWKRTAPIYIYVLLSKEQMSDTNIQKGKVLNLFNSTTFTNLFWRIFNRESIRNMWNFLYSIEYSLNSAQSFPIKNLRSRAEGWIFGSLILET